MGSAGPMALDQGHFSARVLPQSSSDVAFQPVALERRPAKAELMSVMETLLRSCVGTRGALGSSVFPVPRWRNCPDPGGVASKGEFLVEKWLCIAFSRKQQQSALGRCSLLLRDLLWSS